jgi:methyl-accepting chemotaxis protein
VKSSNLTLGYAENFVSAASTVEDYIKNLTFYKTDQNSKIEDIIYSDKTDEIPSLVVALIAPYLVFAAFAIVTLISWLFYCICCCKPCCCCKVATKDDKWCSWKGISFIFMIISLVGIAAICIIGWIFASKLPDNVDEIECSLMRFYTDIKEGETKNSTPKWPGVSNTVKILENLRDALTTVSQNSQNAFSSTEDVKNTKTQYYALLDQKYSDKSGVTVSNPNPKTSGTSPTVTPTFVKKWGPKEDKESSLGLLKVEYDEVIYGSTEKLDEMQQLAENMNQGLETGKKVFQEAIDTIKPLSDEIDKFDTDYIQKFRDNVRLIKLILLNSSNFYTLYFIL